MKDSVSVKDVIAEYNFIIELEEAINSDEIVGKEIKLNDNVTLKLKGIEVDKINGDSEDELIVNFELTRVDCPEMDSLCTTNGKLYACRVNGRILVDGPDSLWSENIYILSYHLDLLGQNDRVI